MKRGGLFFIGLLSAIITITSLNFALGNSWHYNRHSHYCRYPHNNERYDQRHDENQNLKNDSTHNY